MRNIIVAALIAAGLHAAGWYVTYQTVKPPDADIIESLSFNVDTRGRSTPEIRAQRLDEIEHKLGIAAGVTKAVRTYTTLGEMSAVPALAARHELDVSLGAWIGKDEVRNRAEIEAVVALSQQHRNVRSIVVGNETILRRDRTVEQIVEHIREVRRRVKVPVSTGETWDIWLKYPELAKEVDFLAVHILPYWESIPAEQTLRFTLERYDDLRRAFPGKKIVIAEFGWPSQGYNRHDAKPNLRTQADIVRTFIHEANVRGIYYNIIEAFDQPWKTMEGSVGPYWGLFNADGQPKFRMAGRVKPRGHVVLAVGGLLVGLALAVAGLWRRHPAFGHALAYAAAANAMGAGISLAAAYPFTHYMHFGAYVMWGMGFLLMVPLIAMTLAKIHEIAEVILGHAPKRLVRPASALRASAGEAALSAEALAKAEPMVSIHIPAYREQPTLLKQTLDSVAALDYPNFEVVVVINNTPEEFFWKPVEEHCRALGARFKFVNVLGLKGFKAGALNLALQQTAPEAEIIAVIDADYVVHKDWLKDLVPCFADPEIGLVQAPQDHRDGSQSVLKAIMNSEYAGFFDIGMIQRNEHDAIIQHGTMCLVRRSALVAVGGWALDTIVEDTELGLRLYTAGYKALYTNRRYGWGVLPDTFKAFKTQRERWAYGAIQIIRKHWHHMRPSARTLRPEQKVQFVTGWAYWLSDAFGAAASIMNLLWVPAILFVGVLIPTIALTVPIVTAFVVNLVHCGLLYASRVKVPPLKIAGAALAAMSLQLTVAGAVLNGLVRDNLPFKRTDKGGNAKRRADEHPVRWEAALGGALVVAAAALAGTNFERIVEIDVFALTLFIQSLPFLAAVAMAAIEKFEIARAAKAEAPTPAPVVPGPAAIAGAAVVTGRNLPPDVPAVAAE